MAEEQKIYPRGYIAMGSGDLIDVTDVKIDISDGTKQVHTLRQKGAGVTQGVEESTITFNIVIGEDGEEADWLKLVKKNEIKQLRMKLPGRTITANGKFNAASYELPLDDAIKLGMTFVGHIED